MNLREAAPGMDVTAPASPHEEAACPTNGSERHNPYSVIASSTFAEHASQPDLVRRILADPRMHDHAGGFLSCMQCGICTSGCPAARFGDYSPREISRRALDGDPTLLEDDSVWLCFYCYTCQSRCPRGNSVAVINQVIRGLQVESGYGIKHVAMFADWAVQFYERGMEGRHRSSSPTSPRPAGRAGAGSSTAATRSVRSWAWAVCTPPTTR